MSTKFIVGPITPDQSLESRRTPLGRGAFSVLAPALMATVALLLHLLLADGQRFDSRPDALHPYAILLALFLTASLLLVVAQFAWRSIRPWALHYAPLFAGAIVLLGAWDLVTQKLNWLRLPYFPGPNQVLASMIDDRAFLLESTYYSLKLLLTGYALGVVAGIVCGVLIGWFPRVRYWGMPMPKVIGPLPATALIPVVMLLSNESFIPAVALVSFAVWFPVTMLTSSGIASVRLSYIDVARTLGAGRWYLIYHVAVPAALPHIFIGLFMGLLAAFLTLAVAETVGVPAGLGAYMLLQKGYMALRSLAESL